MADRVDAAFRRRHERLAADVGRRERENSLVVGTYMTQEYRRNVMAFYFWLILGVLAVGSFDVFMFTASRRIRRSYPFLSSVARLAIPAFTLAAIIVVLLYAQSVRNRSSTDWHKLVFTPPGGYK